MPGLNLRGSFNTSGVVFAQAPSQSGSTITQQAYGVGSGADVAGGKCAGWGTVGSGVVATAVLAYLWWSLPR